MLSIGTIIFLLIIALCIVLWSINLREHETAISAVKEACKRHDLQLLDTTTHFKKYKFKRHTNGRIKIERQYGFEYFDGHMRQQGKVAISAGRVTRIDFAHNYDHQTPTDSSHHKNNVIAFPKKHKKSE